jgi:hypothetical protein
MVKREDFYGAHRDSFVPAAFDLVGQPNGGTSTALFV